MSVGLHRDRMIRAWNFPDFGIHNLASPAASIRCVLRSSANNHLADLNHRIKIGVIRNVAHDLLRVRSKAALKGVDGIAVDMTHADVGRWRVRSPSRESFVD